MKTTAIINLNDRVTVRLTRAGCDFIRSIDGYRIEDDTDFDGTLTLQLWQIMKLFGPRMEIGGIVMFLRNEISVEIDAAVPENATRLAVG